MKNNKVTPIGTGWPCLSFIRQPIYRKVTIGRDVKITDKGVTIRQDAGALASKTGYLYSFLSWDNIINAAVLTGTKTEVDRG